MASSWTDPARSWSWSRRRGGLVVRASFSALHEVNPVSQVFRERMFIEAVENGTRQVYRQTHLSRMVVPQELKALIDLAGGVEVGPSCCVEITTGTSTMLTIPT